MLVSLNSDITGTSFLEYSQYSHRLMPTWDTGNPVRTNLIELGVEFVS
jgi:hypothetical protein